MAKKSITPKATGVGNASSKLTVSVVPAEKPAKAKKPVSAKTPVPRVRVKASPVTKASTILGITPADIALRAYFIAEKRQKLGLPGDSTSDWVEAERQLNVEAAAKEKP